jgi:hypothetical protein
METWEADSSVERQLLIGMIASDNFLKRIIPVYQPEFIQGQDVQRVARWVLEYYGQYSKAPGAMIQEIFEDKSRGLDDSVVEWLDALLTDLSGEYTRLGFNEQYLFDRSVQHFRKRKLTINSKQVLELLDVDKVDEAEEVWFDSMKIAQADDLGFDPFNEDDAIRILNQDENVRVKMTTGIRSLDIMTGPLKSGWLILFMGPMKRGKTTALAHIAIRSWLLGLNVVFVSLESGDEDTAQRFWMAVGSLTTEDDNELDFPRFVTEGSPAVQFEKVTRPRVSRGSILRVINRSRGARVGKLKVKTYPAFSAGVEDIYRYLDTLEVYEHFSPDVIVVDYIGALADPRGLKGRDIYNHHGKMLKGLAGQRRAAVFSGHQGSREALEKLVTMRGGDVPEDIRLLAHVDLMYGLNQTEEEKEDMLMRINVVAHRWKRFTPFRQALVLQQMEAGKFWLDDMIIRAPDPRGEPREQSEGPSSSA